MGMKVAKFGGSSLADAAQFKKVREILFSDADRRIVVPSAPGKRGATDIKVTDLFYQCNRLAASGSDFAEAFDTIRARYHGIAQELGLTVDLDGYLDEVSRNIQLGAGADYAASRGEYLNGILLADYLGWDFIDPQQGTVMAKFASENLKAKTAVIYVDNSTDYSKSLGKVFKEKFEAAGGKVLMEEAFLAKDQDFKATLTKLKTANADVIFVPAYYEEVGKIVKQARELGITCPILGTDGWDDSKVTDIAGADALNNTYFSTHYSDKDESVKPFVEAFKSKYGHMPNVFAALGYDAGKMLADAIKRAGSGDPEKIQKALEETKDLKVGTGTITMDKNHNPIKQAVILQNKDGDRVMVAKIMPDSED